MDPTTRTSPREARNVAVFTSEPFAPGGKGPLRCDLLAQHGWAPQHDNRHHAWRSRRDWRGLPFRLLRAAERRSTPFLHLIAAGKMLRRSDARLAFFESEGHALALARSLRTRRRNRRPFVVMSCWLSDIVATSPRRRRLYRWLYRGVDHVTVFSAAQREPLRLALGLRDEQVSVVRFGIGVDEFAGDPIDIGQRRDVVAVGRDAARDWETLCTAARRGGWRATLVTRPHLLDGIDVPPNVEVLGTVDRNEYVAMIRRSRVVVVPSQPRTYPTGQSVMLEAMAAGCAVVVTASAALKDYVDERTCLVVPAGDAEALDRAIRRLVDDDALCQELGTNARRAVHDSFTASQMWAAIAAILDELGEQR